jgi:hypothetical protein
MAALEEYSRALHLTAGDVIVSKLPFSARLGRMSAARTRVRFPCLQC